MTKDEIKNFISEQAQKKLALLGIEPAKITDSTDLVKEGIFDSLSFVDLVTDCESHFGIEIDLEKYEAGEFTRVGKLVEIILAAQKIKK